LPARGCERRTLDRVDSLLVAPLTYVALEVFAIQPICAAPFNAVRALVQDLLVRRGSAVGTAPPVQPYAGAGRRPGWR
jgi:hypothetical protein